MEVIKRYESLEERTRFIEECEAQGLTMLYDIFDPDWKRGDEPRGEMVFTDEPRPVAQTEPSLSTHVATLVSIDTNKARPAQIKRVWEGRDYFYDCFVTENVKDQYIAGDINIGDHLLVLFEMGEQIVTAKVFKSW